MRFIGCAASAQVMGPVVGALIARSAGNAFAASDTQAVEGIGSAPVSWADVILIVAPLVVVATLALWTRRRKATALATAPESSDDMHLWASEAAIEAAEHFPAPTAPSAHVPALAATSNAVCVIDVETTGLSAHDRIVSIGLVTLTLAPLSAKVLYLAFDPGRRMHPKAAAINGFRDSDLRAQDPFAQYAGSLAASLAKADVVVGHNVAFDARFLVAECARAGIALRLPETFCTLEAARRAGEHPATLEAVAARRGIAISPHNALSDALRILAHLLDDFLLGEGLSRTTI